MTTLDFAAFFATTPELARWHPALELAIDRRYRGVPHGDERRWAAAVEALPEPGGPPTLNADMVATGAEITPDGDCAGQLSQLAPWRKGPFRYGPVAIDAEWRSNLKWARLQHHLTPLDGRRVIDIGAGNGYYLYRTLGSGAELAVGVDPTRLFLWQFEVFRRAMPELRAHLLPLAGEDLPPMACFDTAFTMGVIYHRREPVTHLREVAAQLRPGGELVVESLVIDTDADDALIPDGRYARMRNVWEIPSPNRLLRQATEAGLVGARIVDLSPTTVVEQRPTPFMTFESLAHCLDPADATRTIEGHPAPVRAVLIASKP